MTSISRGRSLVLVPVWRTGTAPSGPQMKMKLSSQSFSAVWSECCFQTESTPGWTCRHKQTQHLSHTCPTSVHYLSITCSTPVQHLESEWNVFYLLLITDLRLSAVWLWRNSSGVRNLCCLIFILFVQKNFFHLFSRGQLSLKDLKVSQCFCHNE